ncbi:MAG: hypothetical protein G8D61_16040, partial [gamma proteobacterium symbiont of Ctena orbiculata]
AYLPLLAVVFLSLFPLIALFYAIFGIHLSVADSPLVVQQGKYITPGR